jgi:hypothetical protein
MKPVKINPLARWFLSWSSRRFSESEEFSCARKLKEAKKVLICLPSSMDRFAVAKEALPSLVHVFKEKTILVLLPFLKTNGFLSTPAGYEVIYPLPEDLRAFSIPGETLIQKVKGYQFGISLDLELDDGLFNGYLCLNSGIPIRIGSRKKYAYPFYNVQLTRVDNGGNSREIYQGMSKTLLNLFDVNQTKQNLNSNNRK